jgi:protein involved in polysaccharide export with SLBB domain
VEQSPTVCSGTAITTTVYTLAKRTDATVTNLPTGLTSVVDTAAKTVTISGYSTASGTYTITTSGHTAPYSATISGTVTRNLASTIVLTKWNTKSNGMLWYCNYDNGLHLGGSATDATVTIYLLD